MELAYSFHLGSDKNRSKLGKKVAKGNSSKTTSLSNNAIQDANQLSKVNKHNLRDYDSNRELINVIYGTEDLYNDVQNVYLQEFEESRIEYNEKQSRKDRKINNYFEYISKDKARDLACEIIIELGDMDFWQDKDMEYRMKMVEVYKEQITDLQKIVPELKIANAVIHFDETSPHLHLVGVPVKDNNTRGMRKQVGKSKIFTKESLTRIQDEIRNCCIKSYNRVYENTAELKKKQKGRNQDINVKDMKDYRDFKRKFEENEKRLEEVNLKTDEVNAGTNEVTEILDNLKPTKLNKNNMIISNEEVQKIRDYTGKVKDTTIAVKGTNDLNISIRDFEHSAFEVEHENSSLKYQIELKDEKISNLEKEITSKDKTIGKLRNEITSLKEQLQKFKGFWHRIMNRFHTKINYEKDENYKAVAEDLHRNGAFSDSENEIATNIYRKVQIPVEYKENQVKNKNDYNLN